MTTILGDAVVINDLEGLLSKVFWLFFNKYTGIFIFIDTVLCHRNIYSEGASTDNKSDRKEKFFKRKISFEIVLRHHVLFINVMDSISAKHYC